MECIQKINFAFQYNIRHNIEMFNVVLMTLCGGLIGYLLRNVRALQRVNSTISFTICLMLFTLGLSVGSDHALVANLWKFGAEALLISSMSMLGSMLAVWLLYKYVFSKSKEEGK